jgi:hypothetical protein
MGLFSKPNLLWSKIIQRKSVLTKGPKLTGNNVTRNSVYDKKNCCPLQETFLQSQPTEKTEVNKSGGLTDCC